jgi:hypothetical protein
MRRLFIATIAAVSATAVATVAVAQYPEPTDAAGSPGGINDRRAPATPPSGAVEPAASSARMIAHVKNDGTLLYGKAVASVTRPSTGEYCIKPSKGFTLSNLIPSVSVDYSNSLGTGNLVQWRAAGSGCPAGQLDVVTFAFSGSGFTLSNAVGFTLVVV